MDDGLSSLVLFVSGLIILLQMPSFAALNTLFLILDNSKLESGRTYVFTNENYRFSFLSVMKGQLTNHAVKKAYSLLSFCVNTLKNLKYCFP